MLRDEEDRLFAEEMAQSTRRFEDAFPQPRFEAYRVVHIQCAASRAMSKSVIGESALVRNTSRRLCAESAALKEKYKR
jgi:hypothetical protein